MTTVEIIKLEFGIILLLFGAALILLAFVLYHKYLGMEQRCTCRAEGTVTGYTNINYGSQESGVHLPKVCYIVKGQRYSVVGPRYRKYVVRYSADPFAHNEYLSYEKNGNLYIERKANGTIGIFWNPMQEMYPIGSALPVWYDPEKPKLSYVLRCPKRRFEFWLMLLIGLSIWIADALMLILL